MYVFGGELRKYQYFLVEKNSRLEHCEKSEHMHNLLVHKYVYIHRFPDKTSCILHNLRKLIPIVYTTSINTAPKAPFFSQKVLIFF